MRTPKSKVFSIYLVVVLLRFWVKSRMCPNCCHPVPCEKNKKRRRSSWHFLFYIMRPRAVHLLVQEAKQAKCCGKTEKSAKILIRNFKNLKYIQMVYGFSISAKLLTFLLFPQIKDDCTFFQYLQHCGKRTKLLRFGMSRILSSNCGVSSWKAKKPFVIKTTWLKSIFS